MPETIYNWGREKVVVKLGKKVKVPTQKLITDKGLKDTKIPVYHEPYVPSTMSRGFMDYDPLGSY
jgi:hypothetical protein